MDEPKTVTMQQARDSLSEIVDMARWADDVIEVKRYTKTVAYLVGPSWYARARAALEREAEGRA